MSVSRRLRLYADQFDRAVLGLTIELDSDGTVSFTTGEDEATSAFLLSLVGRAAPSVTQPGVVVTPQDGGAYLDAVASMLGRTSRWLVVAE